MRYLVAMIFAIACALVVTLYVSSPVAHWVVSRYSFESPDQVGELHSLVFMATNVAGLLVGWFLGWWLGAGLAPGSAPPPGKG